MLHKNYTLAMTDPTNGFSAAKHPFECIVEGANVSFNIARGDYTTAFGSMTVNWGDGNEETITSISTPLTHKYTDGVENHLVYWDTETGDIPARYATGAALCLQIRVLRSFGHVVKIDGTPETDFGSLFRGCYMLNVPTGLFDKNNQVTNIASICKDANFDDTVIPKYFTKNGINISSISYAFEGSNITHFSEYAFCDIQSTLSNFTYVFRNSKLKQVGARLFKDYTVKRTIKNNQADQQYLFAYCPELETIHPEALEGVWFRSFRGMFTFCTKLQGCPRGFMSNMGPRPNSSAYIIQYISELFEDCKSVTHVDNTLLSDLPLAVIKTIDWHGAIFRRTNLPESVAYFDYAAEGVKGTNSFYEGTPITKLYNQFNVDKEAQSLFTHLGSLDSSSSGHSGMCRYTPNLKWVDFRFFAPLRTCTEGTRAFSESGYNGTVNLTHCPVMTGCTYFHADSPEPMYILVRKGSKTATTFKNQSNTAAKLKQHFSDSYIIECDWCDRPIPNYLENGDIEIPHSTGTDTWQSITPAVPYQKVVMKKELSTEYTLHIYDTTDTNTPTSELRLWDWVNNKWIKNGDNCTGIAHEVIAWDDGYCKRGSLVFNDPPPPPEYEDFENYFTTFTDDEGRTSLKVTPKAEVFADEAVNMNLTNVQTAMPNVFTGMFSSTYNIRGAQFPNLTTIQTSGMRYAFSRNANLLSVDFPVLTTVEDQGLYGAFASCSNLSAVSMPNLQTVGTSGIAYAFQSCSSLTSMTFPSLTEIGTSGMAYTFANCNNLTTVQFPALQSIGSYGMTYAFSRCTSLTDVSFPVLSTVAQGAFYGAFRSCSNIATIRFPALTSVHSSAFNTAFVSCTNLSEIHVPSALSGVIAPSYLYGSAPQGSSIVKYDL